MNLAIVGAGWAGCAAAVQALGEGHEVTLFEATQEPGGRARAVSIQDLDGTHRVLDNGQHILIGAYSATLNLMRRVGADPDKLLLRQPLSLMFADGTGLKLPDWPAPLDALAGIGTARGWSMADKASLLGLALRWRMNGFACDEQLSVANICTGLSPRVRQDMIEPLCVSALNTPASQASARVFLRVLKDSLFSGRGGSNLLLPRVDLGSLFPVPSLDWLRARGAKLHLGQRVREIKALGSGWAADGQAFDALLLATPPWDAVRLLQAGQSAGSLGAHAEPAQAWLASAQALRYEAITTVYARSAQRMAPMGDAGATLPHPMLSLRSDEQAPAQFVFDRGQLGGQRGLLAFVISASQGERADLQSMVCAQAAKELGLTDLRPLQTVVEKRATFACTPGLQRPAQEIATGLLACGDYVDGPYPSTLEGAVRSGLQAAQSLAL